MFTDTDVFSSSPHVGLLWALERLCWSPDYLPAAMDALLRLAEIDIDGQHMSSPMESARLVLWPLCPQTSASLDRRMATLDGLVERFPTTGRKLLLELVPGPGSYWTDNDKPRFRDWVPVKKPTNDEVRQAVEDIKSRVAAMETHADRDLDSTSSKLEELVRTRADLFGWAPVSDTQRQEIVEQRCRAVHEVCDLGGAGAVSSFAGRVRRPELVGAVVEDCFGDKPTEVFLQLLTNEGTDRELALGWVKRMAELQGTTWADRILGDNPGLGDEARADILLNLPTDKEVWDLLAKDEVVPESYWRRIGTQRVAPEYFDTYLNELLEHDRIRHAIQISWTRSKEEPTELIENGTIERVLTAISQIEDSWFGETDVYLIGQLMDLLDPDSETVVSMEGRFFLLFQMTGRPPTGLYGRLRKDPSFFAELVCQVDGRARERPLPDTSRVHLPQSSAWTILQGWRIPPGYDSANGDFEADTLRNWVLEARQQMAERGRSDMGDMYIGELLSGSPTGMDGAWPAEPVRDLLESLESEKLDYGLVSGAVTSRGRTAHGALEGGGQERGLAGLYREMAAKIDTRWLRAAHVLRRLADHYDGEARHRDERAERLADSD